MDDYTPIGTPARAKRYGACSVVPPAAGTDTFPLPGNGALSFPANGTNKLIPRTNVQEAKRILSESGLPITSASDLDDAAKKAVAAIARKWAEEEWAVSHGLERLMKQIRNEVMKATYTARHLSTDSG
ncbi:hypothetical protein IRJ41_007957 [Triplophysa rosa]|uniref:Uncharacterized protein n=1 Tax=Triplophysa rosa TaxID=992332 RepID=A0A9W7TEP2_TRIRA|nr:hypothetical protein IRJ41_007957 [Triplophysa rosa]